MLNSCTSHSPTEADSSGTLGGELDTRLADCSTLTPFVRRQKTSTNTSTTRITNNSTPTIINAMASGEIFITYPGGGGGFGGPLVVLVCVECVVGGGVGVGVGVVQGRDGEIGNSGWPVIPLRFVLWILGQLLKLALWQNAFIFESCSSAKLKFNVFSAMKNENEMRMLGKLHT